MTTAPRALRRMGSLLALAILCLLTMFSISRCKYGPDKVTGLDRGDRSPASQCIHDCEEQYEDSVKAENKLHKKNLNDCKDGSGHGHGDSDDDDDDLTASDPSTALDGGDHDGDHHGRKHHYSPCVKAENARHKAALQRIAQGLQNCIGSCHHQGGGSGGR